MNGNDAKDPEVNDLLESFKEAGYEVVVLKGSDLKSLQENLAKDLHGITAQEAISQGICLNCKELAQPKCYSDAGRREYRISGYCEVCFDLITTEPAPAEGQEAEEPEILFNEQDTTAPCTYCGLAGCDCWMDLMNGKD